MLILHTHWQPPRRAGESGGMLFWQNTDAPQPHIGAADSQKDNSQRSSGHPSPERLREMLGPGTPLHDAPAGQVRLRLPSTRTGPLLHPS